MQFIIHKKKLRVLSAILIAALVLSLGMFAPSMTGQSSNNEVHAAQNDSLLTVTLTGAKTTQFQDYWRAGDQFLKASPSAINQSVTVNGRPFTVDGYEQITVRHGDSYINTLKTDPATGQPLYTYAYDSAALSVYSTAKETWTTVSTDTLYDHDAYQLALDQRTAKRTSDEKVISDAFYAGTIDYNTFETQVRGVDGQYAYDVQTLNWAKYVKPAFKFRFDSKHNNKTATIEYSNAAHTKADYGNIPSQALGGYFGDINDYAYYKTNIETFKLAKGTKKFDLKKAVYLTLKVTPISAPWDGDDFDASAEKWTDTIGQAYLIQGNAGGAADNLLVNALNLETQRFNGKDYENVYHFTNRKTGTYVFPAIEGQTLIFKGFGEYQDGAKKKDGAVIGTRPFQAQWLGGYKNYDIVGNPKNLKKITAGKANKSVGTIKLTKGTGKIQGTITGVNSGHVYAGGVVGDHYESGSDQRDTVAATFAEYAAYMEHKSNIAVRRVIVDNSVAATEAEFINGAPGYNVYAITGADDYGSDPYPVKEVAKAEYELLADDLIPEIVYYGSTAYREGKVWVGPKVDDYKYFKYDWTAVDEARYNALEPFLRTSFFNAEKNTAEYYWKSSLVEITLADYNAITSFQLKEEYDVAGTTHYVKKNFQFNKKPSPAPATEAEYIAYISAAVYNGGAVTFNSFLNGYVETTEADYNALLPTYWPVAASNGRYFKKNLTEVTLDVYNTLPTGIRESYYDASTSANKYFQNNSYAAIDQATFDALPDAGMGYKYFNPTTNAYQYYKLTRNYVKDVVTYAYWKDAIVYTIENLASGVYYVSYGGQVKVIAVKNGKTTKANFKKEMKYPKVPGYLTEITGKKAKGKKLTAKTRIVDPGFGQSQASYKYYWTNGTKIISKKAAYKVSKSYAKKNLWVLSVATFKKYQSPTGWTAAPGNLYGVIGFDVTVTGTFKKGKKVKAVVTNEQVSGVKYKYQWLRNGKAIKKATKSSYKITKADKNKKISVKVTGTVEGYTSKSVKSKATKSK